jgi:cytidine deaminase
MLERAKEVNHNDKGHNPENLVMMAVKAKENAYAPYSQFHVGAALLAENGKVYTGCNVENSSYGASICAERTAVCKAISDGAKAIKALAVSSDSGSFTLPCGICRQVISEFCTPDTPLYLSNCKGEFKTFRFDEILPYAFNLKAAKESE